MKVQFPGLKVKKKKKKKSHPQRKVVLRWGESEEKSCHTRFRGQIISNTDAVRVDGSNCQLTSFLF